MSFHDERQVGGTEPNGDEGGPHLDGSQVQRSRQESPKWAAFCFPVGQWMTREAIEWAENRCCPLRKLREQPGSLK